jgi:hypothetical protein
MNGVGIGDLIVNKVDINDTKTELWRKDGRQGPEWIPANVRLSQGRFKVNIIYFIIQRRTISRKV